MTATPFYTGQTGGVFRWIVQTTPGNISYTDQVVDIQGIDRRASFGGEIKTPELTITLAGYGLYSGDGLGTVLEVRLREDATGQGTIFGQYVIKAIETVKGIVTIKATGYSGEIVPADYNYYTVLARDPRTYAMEWLKSATGGALTASAPAYTDSHHRDLVRVAAPASVLGTLSGVTNTSVKTYLRLGTQNAVSSWGTSFFAVDDTPPAFALQWTPCPDHTGTSNMRGNVPLFWHQRNQYWQFTITAKVSNAPVSTDRCQFPLGILQYYDYYVRLMNGAVENPTLARLGGLADPGQTETVRIEFPTAQAAGEYFREAYNQPQPGVWSARPGTTGERTDIHGITYRRKMNQRYVEVEGRGVYQATKMPYYDTARANLASNAPTIDASPAPYSEVEITLKTAAGGLATYADQKGIAQAMIQFTPNYVPQGWASMGISGNSTLRPAYQYRQDMDPITIDQSYTMRSHFQSACVLGSLGFYEGWGSGGAGPRPCDLCPESGNVFMLPLDIHTAVSVEPCTSYPLPGKIAITFTDAFGQDWTYNYTWADGEPGLSTNIIVMQGSAIASQYPDISGRISLGGNSWLKSPGCIAQRWAGSMIYGQEDVSAMSFVGVDGDSAGILTSDGTFYRGLGSYSNVSYTADYAVRARDGKQYSVFVLDARVLMQDSLPTNGNYLDPYLDMYPLLSWLNANKRAFKDNLTRQSWRVKATLAFAPVVPGDVLAVQLDRLMDGAPCLALVLGVTVAPHDVVTLEIVPMHKITAQDYSDFPYLNEVIPQ